MELELKTAGFETYDTGAETTRTQEETAETIVPDYCPDIARIITTEGLVCLHSRELREGRAELSGTVRVTVLYTPEGEGGKLALAPAGYAIFRDGDYVGSIEPEDGSFRIVYLGDGKTGFRLELTWLRDRTEPYNLGECEFHLALTAADFDAAHSRHAAMGCICYENSAMGIYFVTDPDGYWIEVVPEKQAD